MAAVLLRSERCTCRARLRSKRGGASLKSSAARQADIFYLRSRFSSPTRPNESYSFSLSASRIECDPSICRTDRTLYRLPSISHGHPKTFLHGDRSLRAISKLRFVNLSARYTSVQGAH